MYATSAIFIPVNAISPTMENWVIDVHLIRIWTIPYCYDPTRILSVEMVFMDRMGDKIQASVSRDLLKLKKLEMDEGGYYYISNVVVVPNDGNDRPTRHAFRMVFDRRTKVVPGECLFYTKFGLSPVTCSDILRNKKDTQHLVDKVGLLTVVSCEREYTKDDRNVLAVYLEITDPTGKVECVVYDDIVEDLVEFLRKQGPCTPVIVVQFTRIVPDAQVLFGDIGIETVQHISRILFNPNLPDVFDMREWLVLSGISTEGKIQYRNMDMSCVILRDEFLYFYHKKDIGQLNKQGKGGCFVICATITGFAENEAWWYSACRPHACSSMGSSIYTCDGNFSVIPRYSLKIEVSDGAESTYLQLGDEDVEVLVNVKCSELISNLQPAQSITYPEVFNCLLRKRMLFVVETKSFCDVDEGCIKVLRACAYKELPISRIAGLLGERGMTRKQNFDEGSSYASALPGDNFTPKGSATFNCSSAASASVNNLTNLITPDPQTEPSVDKHCVHFTTRTN
ncbi:Nucleic acid-binding, OB-fold [Sesbania bispinosa]|nr:Nucleic acid-binding, OB-fold [Sesbania bispinosa]